MNEIPLSPEAHAPAGMAPTAGTERFEFLDVLRGFALFGIITANMILYSLYLNLPESAKEAMSTYPQDKVVDFIELAFVEGKFYTIFSVLFGIGFSILLTRTQAKNRGFYRFFLRRMFFLYLIGAAHAILFYPDDILQYYALCGVLLLPFVKAGNRTLLTFAVLALVAGALIRITGAIPGPSLTGPRDFFLTYFGFTREGRIEVWTTGSFVDILRLNFTSWFSQLAYMVSSGFLFKIYGCFLLGFYVGRNEFYKDLENYRPIIKRVAIIGLAIGIPMNLLYAYNFYADESWVRNVSEALAMLPMSAAYAALLCLLWIGRRREVLLGVFAPVGRMALTNYVGQSVICSFIFFSMGLGLGGTHGPTYYIPIGIAVYLFQIMFSRLWLSRFQYGPLEWIWRMLTYGSWITLVKRPVSASPAQV